MEIPPSFCKWPTQTQQQYLRSKKKKQTTNIQGTVTTTKLLAARDKFIMMEKTFTQWQYRSQWSLSEAWLLLIMNKTEYYMLSSLYPFQQGLV